MCVNELSGNVEKSSLWCFFCLFVFWTFNYLFLTARGFCCCTWVSLVLVSWDYSSRCSGFSCWGAEALGHGLSSCGALHGERNILRKDSYIEYESLWKTYPVGNWIKLSRLQKRQRTVYSQNRGPLKISSREQISSDLYVGKICVLAIWSDLEE